MEKKTTYIGHIIDALILNTSGEPIDLPDGATIHGKDECMEISVIVARHEDRQKYILSYQISHKEH